jgi:hypothetical protein
LIARGKVNTIEALWFVIWRMSLWGLCLLAAVGTVYGLFVGGLTFPYGIGFVLTGPIFGTALGLCIGPLEGAVLWGVTMLHRRGGYLRDSDRYRRAAGVACAAVCIVALAVIFEVIARKSGTSFVSGPAYDSDDVTFLLMVIVAPSLSAAWASWWAARKVASQYAREAAAGGFSRHLGEYHLITPGTQREWERGGMSRLRLTLSALLFLAICVLAIGAVLASEGLLQDPLQLATTMISFGINLTDLAFLLALGGLIVVYFGSRGQLRVGIQIALVIVVAQFALSWLAVVVLAVGRFVSGGD